MTTKGDTNMNNLFNMQTERGEMMQNHPNGDTHHCFLCGRKLGKQPFAVEIGVDGYEIGTTDVTESQGGFLLGSECAKQFPTAEAVAR